MYEEITRSTLGAQCLKEFDAPRFKAIGTFMGAFGSARRG